MLREAIRDATLDVSCIGDVRGMGLANAIEIVSHRASKTPDPVTASNLKNAMKGNGVLIGTTGAAANVLKVRPPLAFSKREVPIFVDALVASLRAVDPPR
jgi:4-aminobutyrate aminotransferase-like enzyme